MYNLFAIFLFFTGAQKIETDYKELFLNSKYTDVTIKVKDEIFNCHKCILGARSPFFAVMMESDMKEKNTGVVEIDDFEPTTFKEFLLYLYTGNKNHLSMKNVMELYKMGIMYVMEDLVECCTEHIEKNITIENFYDFFLLSQLHNDSKINDAAICFFLKNSKAITESEEWLELLSKNPIDSNVLIKALANKISTNTANKSDTAAGYVTNKKRRVSDF